MPTPRYVILPADVSDPNKALASVLYKHEAAALEDIHHLHDCHPDRRFVTCKVYLSLTPPAVEEAAAPAEETTAPTAQEDAPARTVTVGGGVQAF